MGENPSASQSLPNPVENVSWDDCQKFLAKLNEQLADSGGQFQLPTEAQWEYACRAGSTTAYYFGDDDAKLGDYAGSWTMPAASRTRWAKRGPTPGDSTTCWATSTNGVPIGTASATTPHRRPTIRPGRPKPSAACSAAATGCWAPASAGPPTATSFAWVHSSDVGFRVARTVGPVVTK